MTLADSALLLGAGALAGLVNAVAGGGVLFVLPAMQLVGLGPVAAAASANLALYPAHAVAAIAVRREIAIHRRRLWRSAAVAVLGGAIGALLLLMSGDRLFARLVPWLILVATLTFALGPRLSRLLQSRLAAESRGGALAFEFAVAVYGGYFGAGLGVLMMAALTLLGRNDLRTANAVKNLLATCITSVAVAIFVAGGAVAWRESAVALAGALAGGYVGARLVQVLPADRVKQGVVTVGALLTIHYFLR